MNVMLPADTLQSGDVVMHDTGGGITVQRVARAIPGPPLIARRRTLLSQQSTGTVVVPRRLAERIVVAIFTDRVVTVVGEHDSKSERGISKTQRRVTVGYRSKGGERDTPQVSITG